MFSSHPLPRSFEVLFQDEDYLAINKPSGLLVTPTPKKEDRTLVSLINEQISHPMQSTRLYPCHRLDRDTSGVIVFSWGKRNQQLLMDEFRKRSIKKEYFAFVHGNVYRDAGRIEGSVLSLDKKKHYQYSQERWAVTTYTVLSRSKDFTVVRVSILTGRSNQIRIHFAKIGHPLLGERKYAFAKNYEKKFRRTALHAYRIEFYHPNKKKAIIVKAPLPNDMSKLWNDV